MFEYIRVVNKLRSSQRDFHHGLIPVIVHFLWILQRTETRFQFSQTSFQIPRGHICYFIRCKLLITLLITMFIDFLQSVHHLEKTARIVKLQMYMLVLLHSIYILQYNCSVSYMMNVNQYYKGISYLRVVLMLIAKQNVIHTSLLFLALDVAFLL